MVNYRMNYEGSVSINLNNPDNFPFVERTDINLTGLKEPEFSYYLSVLMRAEVLSVIHKEAILQYLVKNQGRKLKPETIKVSGKVSLDLTARLRLED